MPKMPDPATGRLDPEDDPFRHCSGVWYHKRQGWTLADDYTVGKAYFRFSLSDGARYYPKGRPFTIFSRDGDR